MSVIAGLSEATIRRQISEAATSHVTDRQAANVDLRHELNNSMPSRDTSVAGVTSTGTNTTVDIVLTEDQATETGQKILHGQIGPLLIPFFGRFELVGVKPN